jgi:hypothetical protein
LILKLISDWLIRLEKILVILDNLGWYCDATTKILRTPRFPNMGIEGEELSKTGNINKSSFATIVFNRINSSQTILVPGWLNELGSWIT